MLPVTTSILNCIILFYIWKDFPIRWSNSLHFLRGISLDQSEYGRQTVLYVSPSLSVSPNSQRLLNRRLSLLLMILWEKEICSRAGGGKVRIAWEFSLLHITSKERWSLKSLCSSTYSLNSIENARKSNPQALCIESCVPEIFYFLQCLYCKAFSGLNKKKYFTLLKCF